MSLSDIVNKYAKVLAVTPNSFQLFIKQATPLQVIEYVGNRYNITTNPKNWSIDSLKEASIYGVTNLECFNKITNDVLFPYIRHPEDFQPLRHEEFANNIITKLLISECVIEVTCCYRDTIIQEVGSNQPATYMLQLIAGLEKMKKK